MQSHQFYQEGFVTQALTGNYDPLSENRLTQLTAASFNHSAVFRRCFLEFLGVRKGRTTTNCRALPQQSIWRRRELGHLDLEITRGGRTVAIVENKVDAPLRARQLRFYAGGPRLKSAKKIALVQNYFDFTEGAGEWDVLHWRDFYLVLCACLDREKLAHATDTDTFILQNFKEYLETAHMHAPTVITKTDLNDLALMLHGLRYPDKTKFKTIHLKDTVFQTAADWIRMMESIFEDSQLMSRLNKAARKQYRFTPCIFHWDEVNKGKDTKTFPWISIQWEITFSKPCGKTKAVGLGLFVGVDRKWYIDAYRWMTGSSSIDSRRIMDARSNIVRETLSKKVLKVWRQWLP